jgi:Ca2+-binding RTX toxin-like protein
MPSNTIIYDAIIYTSTDPNFAGHFGYGSDLNEKIIAIDDPLYGNYIEANGGDDLVIGSASHDGVDAGDGNDIVYGNGGDDTVDGNYGNDLLYGGTGNDWVMGGEGADKIYGGDGNDLLEGGRSSPHFDSAFYEAGSANDTVRGGDGDDTIIAQLMDNGDGMPTANNQLFGDEGNDMIIVTDSRGFNDGSGNTIMGGSGNDMIFAESQANDLIDGGSGVNTIDFSDGYLNFIYPNNSAYDALASVRVDLAITTAQNLGHFGIDTIRNFTNVTGAVGDDTILGNNAANIINGLDGNDLIDGRGGADTIDGGFGKDTLNGGSGNDQIKGDSGLDALNGGSGNDNLIGGAGDDVMSGGTGADTFAFDVMWVYNRYTHTNVNVAGSDTILDFSAAQGDHIHMAAGTSFIGAANFNNVASEVRLAGVSATGQQILSYDQNGDGTGDGTLFVSTSTPLTAADFLFV